MTSAQANPTRVCLYRARSSRSASTTTSSRPAHSSRAIATGRTSRRKISSGGGPWTAVKFRSSRVDDPSFSDRDSSAADDTRSRLARARRIDRPPRDRARRAPRDHVHAATRRRGLRHRPRRRPPDARALGRDRGPHRQPGRGTAAVTGARARARSRRRRCWRCGAPRRRRVRSSPTARARCRRVRWHSPRPACRSPTGASATRRRGRRARRGSGDPRGCCAAPGSSPSSGRAPPTCWSARHGAVAPDRIRVIPNGVAAARCPLPGPRGSSRRPPAVRAPCRRRGRRLPRFAHPREAGRSERSPPSPACPGVHLLVAGDGPERAALEAQAARDAPARVRFAGTVPDGAAVVAAADAVSSSSRTEGMPGVLIEAGLAARPAVAFDVGAVSEVVVDGETGVLVAPDDVPALAGGACGGFSDHAAAMGAAARERCLARFEIGVVGARWAELDLRGRRRAESNTVLAAGSAPLRADWAARNGRSAWTGMDDSADGTRSAC